MNVKRVTADVDRLWDSLEITLPFAIHKNQFLFPLVNPLVVCVYVGGNEPYSTPNVVEKSSSLFVLF